jgi:hypothetical protein
MLWDFANSLGRVLAVWAWVWVQEPHQEEGGGSNAALKQLKEQRTTLLFKENTELAIVAVSKMILAETKSQKSQKSKRKRSQRELYYIHVKAI